MDNWFVERSTLVNLRTLLLALGQVEVRFRPGLRRRIRLCWTTPRVATIVTIAYRFEGAGQVSTLLDFGGAVA